MEVIIVIITTINMTWLRLLEHRHNNWSIKDIDFKKLKATMEAAKKAEDQIQKTGEMAYNQVPLLGWWL